MVKPQFLAIPNIHVKYRLYKKLPFDLETCRFRKGLTPMEMNHFDMKISKFSNRLIFDMDVGDG